MKVITGDSRRSGTKFCTWQSQDEERKKCLPFSNVDIAIMEMKDSCESLRDMMEQQLKI